MRSFAHLAPKFAALAFTAVAAATATSALAQAKKPAKPEPVAPLSEAQLEVAKRVFVGTAACTVGGSVSVAAVNGKPGHFAIKHGKQSWDVTPVPTDSGAVRLENPKTGAVWIQIPAKSMLMNSKIGQRVADGCQMAEQKG